MVAIKGGDKLERHLRELSAKLTKARKLKVGFLEGATYEDAAHTPVAMVAAIQNFGAPKASIPPRPFFSNMVKEKGPAWGDKLARILQSNDFDSSKALELMGEGISEQLRKSIVETLDPPLSQITLMLRRMKSEDQSLIVTGATVGEAARRLDAGETPGNVSTKPLIDSGYMLSKVDYEVSDGA